MTVFSKDHDKREREGGKEEGRKEMTAACSHQQNEKRKSGCRKPVLMIDILRCQMSNVKTSLNFRLPTDSRQQVCFHSVSRGMRKATGEH